MSRLLIWMSRQRPSRVLLVTIFILLASAPIDASLHHPALLLLGGSLGMTLAFGLPVLIVFGMPKPYATPMRRGITGAALVVVVAAVVSTSFLPVESYPPYALWLQIAAGLPLTILVISPFFIATGVIGDARRACGSYLTGDVIQTWFGVFTYPYLGVFLIQKELALLLQNVSDYPAEGGRAGV